MLNPRWRKVLRDLKGNKVRTLLVIMAIAVAVFTVGVVANTRTSLNREMTRSYLATEPASAVLFTEPFGDDLIQVVEQMPAVAKAEGRRNLATRFKVGTPEETADQAWLDLQLTALPNSTDINIHKIWPEKGDWPPPENEIMLERASLEFIGAEIGQTLTIRLPSGKIRPMRIAGTVHDPAIPSPAITGQASGFINVELLPWLNEQPGFDQLNLIVADRTTDSEYIRQVAETVRNKIEKSGRLVNWIWVPDPGRHPAEQILDPLLLLLGAIGLLSLLLSGLLTANTVSALLVQQVRQIGVMKAIGAYRSQIAGMYLVSVLTFGLLALIIALPLSVVGAWAVTNFIADLINLDRVDVGTTSWVLLLQVVVGLLTPLLAALKPVLTSTQVTVREAINEYGVGRGYFGQHSIDRLLKAIPELPRPVLLSLRNTFRRKGRLILTLLMLTLASAIFIAVFSVRASLLHTLDDALDYWNYDIQVQFSRPYRAAKIEQEILEMPGIVGVESWGFESARRVRPDNSESENLVVIAPPSDTQMINPTLIEGRWLLPEDKAAVVINTEFLRHEPNLQVGDEMVLNIGGRESTWTIVGLVRGVLTGPIAYANYPHFTRVVRSINRASSAQLVVQQRDQASLDQLAQTLEAQLPRQGLRVESVQTTSSLRQQVEFQFNILVVFLFGMAILLALVGALGLTGTMSINVLERTREFGIMRATGASTGDVLQIVIVEGVVIGLLSWAGGALLSLPLSWLLSNGVGLAFLDAPLTFSFSTNGMLLWLATITILASLASFLPAWQASRFSVQVALTYD